MVEQWKPVVGYPNYEVSDLGNVRSLDHLVKWANKFGGSGQRLRKGKLLKLIPAIGPKKYLAVGLYDSKKKLRLRPVHVVVLEAFVGPCPVGQECRHLDGNHLNNRLQNLKWGTKSENALDRVLHGNDNNARKSHCPRGHEYTPENTYVRQSGWRQCRACGRKP